MELEYEFYCWLVEKQLFIYCLYGELWCEKVIECLVVYKDYDEQLCGLFIVCVDIFGLMGGFNEQCVKVFCLVLMCIVFVENWCCYIMLFFIEIVCYEFLGL